MSEPELIMIRNAGAAIESTNYFDGSHAAAGLFYVSINAGAVRLLVPDVQLSTLAEMRTGHECIITRGRMRGGHLVLELMFEDRSDEPFAIHVDMRQCDRDMTERAPSILVSAWTRHGLVASWPGRFRTAATLPCLRPWP